MELVRYSPENPNDEALKGKFGGVGEIWGKITVIKNVVFIIAYKGAKVSNYALPECYDGFVQCSDGTTVQINDSKLSLDLGPEVTAQGFLQLKADN